jgi:hypothetical protein
MRTGLFTLLALVCLSGVYFGLSSVPLQRLLNQLWRSRPKVQPKY